MQGKGHFVIPHTAGVKDILAALDSWAIRTCPVTAEGLWRVLTALRGPDDCDKDKKKCLTRKIRYFLRNLALKAGADVSAERPRKIILPRNDGLWPDHFINHIRAACWALDIPTETSKGDSWKKKSRSK